MYWSIIYLSIYVSIIYWVQPACETTMEKENDHGNVLVKDCPAENPKVVQREDDSDDDMKGLMCAIDTLGTSSNAVVDKLIQGLSTKHKLQSSNIGKWKSKGS